MKVIKLLFLFLFSTQVFSQNATIRGVVLDENDAPLPYANVLARELKKGDVADINGKYSLEIPAGTYSLSTSFVGYLTSERTVKVVAGEKKEIYFQLAPSKLKEVVVTGTLKEMKRLDSPVPVEVYTPQFFKKNPTPNMYEALQNVNGVRPQLNCNVCNTGDIHINGLEGPYTMILIDGMPIVSGLSTVYGLSGIPNSMIERMEIVKGPASSLYGSEAVGGLINIITKKPANAASFTADAMATTWQEFSADFSLKLQVNDKASVLTGVSLFDYSNPIDNNNDNFTDVTLQDRVSVFQKWNFKRKKNRLFSLAGRYLYEDRWGGEMNWNPEFRGGNQVYGESIYTSRWEVLGSYQLPVKEKMLLALSFNDHNQNSFYGDVPYHANQKVAFSQLSLDKRLNNHDLLFGTALRYIYYDDNTTATADSSAFNQPNHTYLPGIFMQDEITVTTSQKILLGLRYDYHSNHGNIFTPRLAYKYTYNPKNIFRLNAGTGFRVVNLFTEEHAALTGAREVIVEEALNPEQSYNANINYIRKFFGKKGTLFSVDASGWYTYFTNQILPDYDTNSNQIIYDNLDGHAITQGVTLNLDLSLNNGLKLIAGATYMDVKTVENGVKVTPVLTEAWTGTWAVSYKINKLNLTMDYTGNLYGPMRLPVLGEQDPRAEFSPWWSLQNIQFTWTSAKEKWEIYAGVKNLLNFTPAANSIARSHDPFDKEVTFDKDGNPVATPNNPYAQTFDPSYVYAPNQGIRGFLGVRYTIH